MEVDYQGGGSYKRKYRVREIIAKGPFDLFFRNEQVWHAVSVILHAVYIPLISRVYTSDQPRSFIDTVNYNFISLSRC